jgi:Protein of unknown function (DUF2924)
VDERLAMEIEGLRKMKMKALQARYQELFGEETRSSNQAHLFRRMAWRLQANAAGGLSERAQKRAGELAEEAALRLRAPRQFWREDGSVGLSAPPARMGGCHLSAQFSNGTTTDKRLKWKCSRGALGIETRSTVR